MQVGSLVKRKPNTPYGNCEGIAGLLPYNTPVVISDWQFASTKSKDMFEFQLHGYETISFLGFTVSVWYHESALIELQPPMSLSFLQEIQIAKPEIKELV